MRQLVPFAVVTGFLLLVSGCLEGKTASTISPTPSAPAMAPAAKEMYVVATDVSSPGSEGVFKMRMTGGATTFNAKKDDRINLTLKNAVGNQYVHNLVLDGYTLKLVGKKDSAVSIEFNATKTGSYKFYCDLTQPAPHRQLGMEGTLVVA